METRNFGLLTTRTEAWPAFVDTPEIARTCFHFLHFAQPLVFFNSSFSPTSSCYRGFVSLLHSSAIRSLSCVFLKIRIIKKKKNKRGIGNIQPRTSVLRTHYEGQWNVRVRGKISTCKVGKVCRWSCLGANETEVSTIELSLRRCLKTAKREREYSIYGSEKGLENKTRELEFAVTFSFRMNRERFCGRSFHGDGSFQAMQLPGKVHWID